MPNMRSSTGKNVRYRNRNADKRLQKHMEATDRNLKWQALSPYEQLANLDARGESAKNQRRKIAAKIQEIENEARAADILGE